MVELEPGMWCSFKGATDAPARPCQLLRLWPPRGIAPRLDRYYFDSPQYDAEVLLLDGRRGLVATSHLEPMVFECAE